MQSSLKAYCYYNKKIQKKQFFSKKLLTNPLNPCIIYELALIADSKMRACWNWQTGTFEGRVLMAYGFKSHHSHQKKASILIQDWCFFQRNKSFRICEMHFVREILLRNVKYALRRVDLFHFTESVSFLFHNFYKKLFHIKHCLIFHLWTICIIYATIYIKELI